MRKLLPFIILLFAFSASAQTGFTFKGEIISETAYVRADSKRNAKILVTLQKGDEILSATEVSQRGWYYVWAKNKKGWIHGNDFKFYYTAPLKPSDVPAGWYLISKSNDKTGYSYYYLFSSVKRKDDSVEVWTRIVPFNAQSYAKKFKLPKGFAYAIEYVTVDCEDKRVSTENTTFYNRDDETLPFNNFFLRTYREPIVPGSIGESLWRTVCK